MLDGVTPVPAEFAARYRARRRGAGLPGQRRTGPGAL